MLVTAIALLAYSVSANSVASPAWQADYTKAYSKAVEQHKPLAVFIGTGPKAVVPEGLTDAAGKLMAESYVVVYIDASSNEGGKLAARFGMSQGLVISDKTGDKQALRLNGAVNAADLSESLVKFADTGVVTTTATSPRPVVTTSYYPQYAPMQYAPMGGGCASGRCPNAR